MFRFCMFILIAAGIIACKSNKPVADLPPTIEVLDTIAVVKAMDTLAYYERTACFGMCPIFKCVILENGQCQYEGRNFVERIGLFQTTFDAAALHKIKQLADQISYFSMKPSYDHTHVTDLPSIITRMNWNGRDLTVNNRYQGPKDLQKLYQLLDDLIKDASWTMVVVEQKQ